MIKASMKVANPDTVDMTLTATLTIEKWRVVDRALADIQAEKYDYAVGQLQAAISDAIFDASKVFVGLSPDPEISTQGD